MHRTTRADVANVVSLVQEQARIAGLIPADYELVLQAGSPTYGRAWRLFGLGDPTVDITAAGRAAYIERMVVGEFDIDDPDLIARREQWGAHFDRLPRGTGHYNLSFVRDYLGDTARMAERTLRAVFDVLWEINDRDRKTGCVTCGFALSESV